MKRSQELIALTREHHHALVLARRAIDGARELATGLAEIFASELEPHFQIEEETLLPPMRDAGELARVARTLDEHRRLRALAQAVKQGDLGSLAPFGRLLEAHVRFEERDLFPCAEAVLPAAALAAVAACAVAKPTLHR
jgi:hemerythrin-like domain-containing protein